MNTKLIFINSDNDNDTCLILHAENITGNRYSQAELLDNFTM